MKQLAKDEFFQRINKSNNFINLNFLYNIYHVMIETTLECERTFSVVKIMKTTLRNRISYKIKRF